MFKKIFPKNQFSSKMHGFEEAIYYNVDKINYLYPANTAKIQITEIDKL